MSDEPMPSLAIIGGGPAGLMAAEVAAAAGAAVTVFDRMPSVGRKMLMAGRGGLNLTHSEDPARFLLRYGEAAARLAPALAGFDAARLRAWSGALGEPTVVGSSGRVFPQSFKTSPLLRAWLRRLEACGVRFRLRHRWTGWTAAGGLAFDTPDGPFVTEADATVLALGGASWPRLGADGHWTTILAESGIEVAPLRPSNCGFVTDWPAAVGERFAGEPLKGIRLDLPDGRSARGEATVTRHGIEGGAVYALSGPLRDTITERGEAMLTLALRPDMAEADIARRLAAQPPKASLSTALRKALKLPPVAVALVGEARRRAGAPALDVLVNVLPLRLTAPAALDRAISTAGGIRLAVVDDAFMLRGRPGTFVAGEMLDWEAPTGGYLLQACFATGAAAGRGAARWLSLDDGPAASAGGAAPGFAPSPVS